MISAESMSCLLGQERDSPAVESLRNDMRVDSWPARISRNEIKVALSAEQAGFDLTFLPADKSFLVHQLNFWSKDYVRNGYTPFAGQRVKGLVFGQTFEAVAELLGPLKRSRVEDEVTRGATWIADDRRMLAQLSRAGLSSLEFARVEADG